MSIEDELAEIISRVVAPLVNDVRELRAELRALRAALPPVLLRPAEVASRYGIPLSSQRRHIKSGQLRSVRVGRTVLIDVSTLHPLNAEEIAAMAADARGRRST